MSDRKRPKWYSSPRTLLRQILMLDDTAHSIALGTAIGMFIGMTPTVGIQMIVVVIFAFLIKPLFSFNRVAALITVYISNPLTTIPIYWFNYKVGTLFIDEKVPTDSFLSQLKQSLNSGSWDALQFLFVEIGWPLIFGSLIVATVLGVATYPFMRWVLRAFGGEDTAKLEPDEEQVPSTVEQT